MNATTDITCNQCQASNPLGAKFCSSCRNSLQATGSMPPPPPPPPQRPSAGMGAMMSGGGKTVTKQIAGDAQGLYQQALAHFQGQSEAEVQYEVAPQQLVVKAPFKSFWHTSGITLLVDTTVQIAQTSPGQCQVSVTTKTDNGSAKKLWILTIGVWLLVCVMWMFAPVILLFGAAVSALGFWILQSAPGEKVTKDLFTDLLRGAGATTGASQAAAAAAAAAATPVKPEAQRPAAAAPAASEEDIFDRIDKLARLKASGAISEAEFDAKKAELLSRV